MGKRADHELQIPRIIEEIRKRGSRLVGVQLPDGLKRHIPLIKEHIEAKTEAAPVFSTEPCFGACDVSESLPGVGCDLIIHIGHTPMVAQDEVPVVYIPGFSRISASDLLGRNLGKVPRRRLGLLASVQHVHELAAARRILAEEGFDVIVGGRSPRTEYPGQVLGCDFGAAREVAEQVDLYLYLGGGNFHALGVALATGKEVIIVDPYAGELRTTERLAKKMLHQRFARVDSSRDARRFGFLLSTKPGQRRLDQALEYRNILISRGLEVTLLSYDLLDPARLVAYDLDAFVNFGCPRIPLEDSALFSSPVLTPPELEVVLGIRSWEELVPDEIAQEKT